MGLGQVRRGLQQVDLYVGDLVLGIIYLNESVNLFYPSLFVFAGFAQRFDQVCERCV
jgi:hypothetical protein